LGIDKDNVFRYNIKDVWVTNILYPIIVEKITTPVDQFFNNFEIQCSNDTNFDDNSDIVIKTANGVVNGSNIESVRIMFEHTKKGTEYYIRARVVNIFGQASEWGEDADHIGQYYSTETAGDTDAPEEITSSHLTQTYNNGFKVVVEINDTYTPAPDTERYEWLIKETSSDWVNEDPIASSPLKYITFSIDTNKTYYIFVRAVDRSGNYSPNYGTYKASQTTGGIFPDSQGLSWIYDGEFTAINNKGIQWTDGTLYLSDGTSHLISAGSITDLDSNSYATRYVYFDSNVSSDVFQVTPATGNAGDSIGEDQLLIASANGTSEINNNASMLVFAANAEIVIKKIEAQLGTIGAFDIGASDISASNMILHSGANPYIALGATDYFSDNGIWLGRDSSDGIWKLSTKYGSAGINWDGVSFTILSNDGVEVLKVNNSGANIAGWGFDDVQIWKGGFRIWSGAGGADNPYIGMNISSFSGNSTGIWFGLDISDSLYKFIAGNQLAQRMQWDGSKFSIYDYNNQEVFSADSSQVFLGGWYLDTTGKILRSTLSATDNRLEANPVKNRYSVFEAATPNAIEKTADGFLEGLIRNNATGTAYSGTTTTLVDNSKDWKANELYGLELYIIEGTNSGEYKSIISNTNNTITTAAFSTAIDNTSKYEVRYTSEHYGFWALQGNHLSIDGDMTYDSGDWLIQHNGSLKILDGNNNEIIKLGSDITRKGLFIYDQYHNVISQIHSTGLEIGSSPLTANSLTSDNATVWHFEDNLIASDGGTPSSETCEYTSGGKFDKGIFLEDGTTNYFSDRLDFQTNWQIYAGATATITSGQSDPDSSNTAYRIETSGGTSTLKYYTNFETSASGYHYSQSVWIKNIGTNNLTVFNNGTSGETTQVVTGNSSSWVRVELANNLSTSSIQLQFKSSDPSYDLDFLAWHPQMEKLADADGICTVTSFTESTRSDAVASLSSGKSHTNEGTIAFYWNPVVSNNRKYPQYISYTGMNIKRESANSIRFLIEDGGNTGFDLTLALSKFTFDNNKQYFMVFRWNQALKKSNITIYDDAGIVETVTSYIWQDEFDSDLNCMFISSNSIVDELVMTNYYTDDEQIKSWFDNQSIFSMSGRTLVNNYGFLAYNSAGEKTVDIEGATGDAIFTGDVIAKSLEISGAVTGANVLDVSYIDTEKDTVFHFDENTLSTRGDSPIVFNPEKYQINHNQGKFGGGIVLAEASKNIIGTSSWGGYSNRDGIEFKESPNRWTSYSGATVTVAKEKLIADPFGNYDAYRIKTTGGSNEVKYYIDRNTSASGTTYSYSMWVKNIGVNDMVVHYFLGGDTTTIPAGSDWTLVYDEGNAGNDSDSNMIEFETPSGEAANSLEFLAFEPQIEENEDCTAFMEDERSTNSTIAYNKNLIAGKKKCTIGFWYNPLLKRPAATSTARIFSLETDEGDAIYVTYRSSYVRCYIKNAGTQIAYISDSNCDMNTAGNDYFFTISWDAEAGIARTRTYYSDGTLMSNAVDEAWTGEWPDFNGIGDFYLGSKDGLDSSKTTVNALISEFVIFGDEYKTNSWLDNYAIHSKPFYDSNEDIIRAGGRVRIDSSRLIGYNSLEEKTFEIGTATGDAYFKGNIDALGGTFSGSITSSATITGGKVRTSDETNVNNQSIVLDSSDNTLKFYKSNRSTPFDSDEYCISIDDDIYNERPGIRLDSGYIIIEAVSGFSDYTRLTDGYLGIGKYSVDPADGEGKAIFVYNSIDSDNNSVGGRFQINSPSVSSGYSRVAVYGSTYVTSESAGVLVGVKGTAEINSGSGDIYGIYGNATINNGTGNAWAGYFEHGNVKVQEKLVVGSGAFISEFSTDGTLSGNSDDAVPTEKAVKTYVDDTVGGSALDRITSGNNMLSVTNATDPIFGYYSDTKNMLIALSDTNGNVNVQGYSGANLKLGFNAGIMLNTGTYINEFSTDGTLSGNSDDAVPTEKAVKTYVDNHSGGSANSIYSGHASLTVSEDVADGVFTFGSDSVTAVMTLIDTTGYLELGSTFTIKKNVSGDFNALKLYNTATDQPVNIVFGNGSTDEFLLSYNNFKLSINNVVSGDKLVEFTQLGSKFYGDGSLKLDITDSGTVLHDSLTLNSGTSINEFSTDGSLTDNSDDAVPTEKAVKTYVDNHSGGAIVDKIGISIDGGGGVITTGIKGDIEIPYACTINAVTMLADQTGSIEIDLWKSTYTNFPPDDTASIVASAKPTILSSNKSQDTTLTGWTTSVSAGDIIRFAVDSCSSIKKCTLTLKVTK